MDEVITFVFVDQHGTEVSEEYDSAEEAHRQHAQEEWDPRVGPLRLVRKTYVFTGTYEDV